MLFIIPIGVNCLHIHLKKINEGNMHGNKRKQSKFIKVHAKLTKMFILQQKILCSLENVQCGANEPIANVQCREPLDEYS